MRLPDRVGRAGFSPLLVGRTIAKPRGFTAILMIVVVGKDGCIILAGKSIWLRGSTGRRQLRGVLYNLHTSMMCLFFEIGWRRDRGTRGCYRPAIQWILFKCRRGVVWPDEQRLQALFH